MGIFDKSFDKILEISTEVERRRIAERAMCAILSNEAYAPHFTMAEIAWKAVTAADALIAELNKKKDYV